MSACENFLIYDGDCPFCSGFVTFVRLQETLGDFRLLNARDPSPELEEARQVGFVIDDGMLMKIGGQYYHGADCMNRISLLTTKSGVLNKLVLFVFRNKQLSRFVYPMLRFFRNTTIKILGVSRLGY